MNETAGTVKPMDVRLISMPFGPLEFPSIALTQLKSAVKERFGTEARVTIHYLNHDFGVYFSPSVYNAICQNENASDPNSGDWIFRQAAFPDVPDNFDEYLSLIPEPYRDGARDFYQAKVSAAREGIPSFMEALIQRYQLAHADVIGFTSMFAQNLATIAMARAIKRHNRDSFIMVGGANCEFPMGLELLHSFDCFDAVASGPGTISFPELLDRLAHQDHAGIHGINGVFTRRNASSASDLALDAAERNSPDYLLRNGIKPLGDERPINNVLELDYDCFLDEYERLFSNEMGKPYITFETSRGCWWGAKSHCTFCGLNGQTVCYRSMAPETALKHLRSLIERYRDRVSHFDCIDNVMPPAYTTEVFPYLNPPEDAMFYWEIRPDVTESDLESMAEANVCMVQPGIESLSTDMLRHMKKGVTAFANIKLLRDASMYEIEILWYLMLGFPGEPEDVYKKYILDFPSFWHLRPPVTLIPLEYHRYSPYFNHAEKYNLTLRPRRHYGVYYPLPEKTICNLAYYFRDAGSAGTEQIALPPRSERSSLCMPRSPYDYHSDGLKRQWLALNEQWEMWEKRFYGRDKMLEAELCYRPRRAKREVVDNRSGKTVCHQLTSLEYRLCRFLDQAHGLHEIVAAFPDHTEDQIRLALDKLDTTCRLLFSESNRHISLVPKNRRTGAN